jgi:hypothetical protein
MEVAGEGARTKSGSKSKRKKAAADRPASDIGKSSPTSAEDAEYANDIMGTSDEEYGRCFFPYTVAVCLWSAYSVLTLDLSLLAGQCSDESTQREDGFAPSR